MLQKKINHLLCDDLKIGYNRELEAKKNFCSFSLSDQEKCKIKLNDVVAFLKTIMSIWKKRLIRLNICSITLFYAWYDEMANTLCFSLVSGTLKEPLPFKCRVKITNSIKKVCLEFLKGKDYIPCEDLKKNDDEEEWEETDNEKNDFILTVYACNL